MTTNTNINELIIDFYRNGMIKLAEHKSDYFTLKSGQKSPIYINLRNISTDMGLLDYVCLNLYNKNNTFLSYNQNYDVLCGVPYGGINYAIYLSITILNNHPYLIKRKEKKKHGLNNMIDGEYKQGTRCVLVEDVVTTGMSLLQTIQELEACGIKIVKVLSIINREQGGIEMIRNRGYKISSLISLNEILETLTKNKLITLKISENIKKYISDNQFKLLPYNSYKTDRQKSRLITLKNPLARNILKLMYQKKTNLALSLDIVDKHRFLQILEKTAEHICILKTHINIVDGFDDEFISNIKKLQDKYNFYILEDGKFSDISNTFKKQLTGGVYKINSWANSITAHSIAGKTLIDVYKSMNSNLIDNLYNDRGIVFVAEMSNKGNLITENYTKNTIQMCANYRDTVVGFVSQKKIADDNYLYLTPGVSLETGEDQLDQCYRTPEDAIGRDKCDIIIVGRAIYNNDNPESVAIQFKNRGWTSFQNRF